MNDLAAKVSSRPASKPVSPDDDDSLPSLFGRMGDELTKLVDLRFNLLKVEIQEDVGAYVHHGVMMAIGGIIVAVGFALANIALSFFISTLFANSQLSQPGKYGLGFTMTGLIYLIAGGIILAVTKRRLAAQDFLPRRSLAELESDKQMVKTLIQG
jgi:uncharacterized membrane protein YqjE